VLEGSDDVAPAEAGVGEWRACTVQEILHRGRRHSRVDEDLRHPLGAGDRIPLAIDQENRSGTVAGECAEQEPDGRQIQLRRERSN
jgi:hypothetical protein